MKRLSIGVWAILLWAACSSKSEPYDFENRSDSPLNPAVEHVLKRAIQMSQIEWTPKMDVPNNLGVYYSGYTVKGMPYSSVKELEKFIGFDVSIRTFMTAVHNPRSVLYTENISKAPYNGNNCASYYGVVCSSVVNYALGLPVNYVTASLDTLSSFWKVSPQDPNSIEVCDVLYSSGHEVMVYDIARKDSDIIRVSILESAGTSTRISTYSMDDFTQRWNNVGWVLYRYKDLNNDVPYEPSPFIPLRGEISEPYPYNEMICPSRGDCAVYREGEEVTINVLDYSVVNLSLLKGDSLIENRGVGQLDVVFKDLSYGSYSVVATDAYGHSSDAVHFEIVDTDVTVQKAGDRIRVSYASRQGTPLYIKLCSVSGHCLAIKELNDEDVKNGSTEMTFANTSASKQIYCKVFFFTPNGRVTNKPIRIE